MGCVDTELAYIAGFLDGEGCITLVPRKKRGVHNGYFSRVFISNTNESILRWVEFKLGGYVNVRKHTNPHKHKRGYQWYISEALCESFLLLVRPYLRIKGEQADLLLEYRKTVRESKHYPDRLGMDANTVKRRNELYQQMRRLNKKGPPL